MEWQQFEYFQTLARMQHVTHAAEALSISQSALSRSIARFEDEIGVPLFERQGRSIRLNKYGHIFLKRVDNMMNEFYEGKQEIKDLLDPEQGEVSLGFLHTLSTSHIPDILASFRSCYPKINFRLGQGPSHNLIDQLQSGEFDLCLIASMENKSPIVWRQLWNEELFVIVPKDHKYAYHKNITLEEIADESFIHLKKGFSLRITFDQLFKEAGITPKITFEGEEADTVAGLVAAGLGISILPNLKGTDQSKISQIPINSKQCQRTIGIAWVDGRYLSPATQKFKQYVLDHSYELE
ncbi:LysR family transcriptional regulator [Bacillus sp. ISL-40]|uniref:LysR family transcriptional regulator n=1 Tax=unclassified Bacillus (in: firmicutes) TaxID=185979 RepID=UPI001BE53E87|nr:MULTISPECIES: LysR family transcriptional regulator [unclassified Bacillus (in: firmicutes)]MBT2701490.1 LysR family transcriptional regulator [Bacillus sp. ISL-40]MBT2722658.1 LysR family transcriptional regulator [Bacillus sp. ISL-46]MBT2739432.1 LysR family transcriptional regulator [Bacillus sp. ISL-77]